MLDSDMVITAGGQTMLEAAATGLPSIALPLVDNQRSQSSQLAALGAVSVVDPPVAGEIARRAQALAGDLAARRLLSRNAQQAVDGYGALRVAYHVARLLDD
jgi:spore coat polysaccharide biosynthesis predicted glycosyltransferase SpsG